MRDGVAAAPAGVPRHLAIIMDGNGRWARVRGLPRTAGHHQGAEALRRTVEGAAERGIGWLTVFGFSAENWKRPAGEVEELMSLLRRYLKSDIAELHSNDVRLRVVGDRDGLPGDVTRLIADAEETTRANTRLTLTVAVNYGGRQDVTGAARRLAMRVAGGDLDPEAIDQSLMDAELDTHDVPDPDVVLRTSGEKRLSNFLLWQSAYSELMFSDTLWPDFGRDDLDAVISAFGQRDRRYGATVQSR